MPTVFFYLPPLSFRLPVVPSNPSDSEVASAVEFLKKNLFSDFRFAGEPEIANCFAAIITPFVREMITGATPLFWVAKSVGGSGGTLLSNVIAAPILGAEPSGVTAPNDEAEWIRIILSTLLRSPTVFFIDNCNDDLTSEALAHAITSAKYEGRVIGSSVNEAAEVRCLWLINGNNLHFGWELVRRVVRIRIEAHADQNNPSKERTFVHADLLTWIFEHRAEVICNLLVIIRAWLASGCPGPAEKTPQFPSFESWRRTLGGILNIAGISGFLANLEEARREGDEESGTIRAFISAWEQAHGLKSISVAELMEVGEDFYDMPPRPHAASIKLGKILAKYESQVHGGLRIVRLPQSHGRTQWVLQRVSEDGC